MLSSAKLEIIKKISSDFSRDEIIWTKGYLSGLIDGQSLSVAVPTTSVPIAKKTTIIYGTETGNSKKLALTVANELKKAKISAKVSDMQTYKPSDLKKEEVLLFVVSTQGDGEFPQSAQSFYDYLTTNDLDLSHTQYAIFGLGDSSYPLFCNAGILLDEVLVKRKSKSILPMVKGDVDYQNETDNWVNSLTDYLTQSAVSSSAQVIEKPKDIKTILKQTYKGIVSKNLLLNDRGSLKSTHHIEIDFEEDVAYLPGDAIGIYPENHYNEILKILHLLNLQAEDLIQIKGEEKTAKEWLKKLNIKGLSKKTLDTLGDLIGVKNEFKRSDLYPFLLQSSGSIDAATLFSTVGKVAPRLYSIASSPSAHQSQIHLTVSLNTFNLDGVNHYGLASKYLLDYHEGKELEFYIHANSNFRLPEEDKDIIMIGPGTGIAPFRSFIAERDATMASGKSWLFFGEQTFAYDFYYQTEIQEWLSTGSLSKFNGAFSRDQKDKIYVQHRIKECATEFYEWIENGATIYICGQKDPMSIDVEKTIIDIISDKKGLTIEESRAFLDELSLNGRYHKDVY